ncbi:hypothetical protein [Streptomyces sp. Ag109_O5-10]|uniref:hypothetical protein n=1 Tax=Streptomyces sp. Ag109_O5-10 TaxID=1855349 RepID=UPI0008977FDF|nr:hypothetical protein [Streptomyces sp. Ag109_O5-10]SEF18985.1 hypothetical protein SAMN05216533_8533 [Streptomyces sp. Ag109_O5-10]
MSDDFGSSYLERGWEAPEEVILRRELVRTPGLQPEDLGVLAELLLRDPRLPSTMEAIRADLQAQGWKMGKDRYNAIAKRLTTAGHLARVSVFDPSTGRPTWVTRVYRNPANNTQYVDLGIAASQQVSPETRVSRDPHTTESQETRVSPGQSRNAENPQSGPESRKTRDLETRVSPGQRRNTENPHSASPPPHPPEEEESSSPNPLTGPARSLPSQREQQGRAERTPEFTDEQLRNAAAFLASMQRWQAGAATARRCAPRLLRAMRDQGWPLLADLDDAGRALLEADVLKNTQGAASWAKCLPGWVDDLRLYAKVKPRVAAAGSEGGPDAAAVRLALVAACTACDPSGWLLDDNDDAPMRRCTHPGVTAAAAGEAQR